MRLLSKKLAVGATAAFTAIGITLSLSAAPLRTSETQVNNDAPGSAFYDDGNVINSLPSVASTTQTKRETNGSWAAAMVAGRTLGGLANSQAAYNASQQQRQARGMIAEATFDQVDNAVFDPSSKTTR